MELVIILACTASILLSLCILFSVAYFRNQNKLNAVRKETGSAKQRTDAAKKELREIQESFIDGNELYKWIGKHSEKGSVSISEFKKHILAELDTPKIRHEIPAGDSEGDVL